MKFLPILAVVCALAAPLSAQIGHGAAPVEKPAPGNGQAQLTDFYGTLTGSVVSGDAEKVVLKVARLYAYTPLADESALRGQNITVFATPAALRGTEGEIRNHKATTPRREHATAFFASLRPNQTIELGVYGDLNTREAKLARLPGPTSWAPNAPLPAYFGANVDERAVGTTIFVATRGGKDGNDGLSLARPVATLERAFELARRSLDRGQGTRIRVAPGVYRPKATLSLSPVINQNTKALAPLSDAAKNATFILEAEKPDTVFVRGSVTRGFEPSTWTLVDAGKKIYKHAWTPNWGMTSRGYYKPKPVVLHRRELLALNGKILEPVLLENTDYVDPSGTKYDEEIGLIIAGGGKPEGTTGTISKGWRDPIQTLRPGQFGIAEKGPGEAGYDGHADPNSIFLRLPIGVDSLDKALVEVGVLQTILRVQDKSNFVLRNLTFEHSANFYNDYYEKAAIDTNLWRSYSDSHDWLWDGVTVKNNRSSGAMLWWVRNMTMRNCHFTDNGHLGIRPSFVRETVMENCRVDRNNTRGRSASYIMHTTGGLDFTGQNCVFRGTSLNDNFGCGFRSDYGLEDVLFEGCEVARNERVGGVFHEIEFGPVTWRNSRITNNTGKRGMGILNVNRVTMEGCTLANNEGGQFEFYVSPPRKRNLEMQPLGWSKFEGVNETPRGDIRGFTFRNNTFVSSGVGPLIGTFFREGDVGRFAKFVRSSDFSSENNTFWNAHNPHVFEVSDAFGKREFVDLSSWRAITGQDKSSVWKQP